MRTAVGLLKHRYYHYVFKNVDIREPFIINAIVYGYLFACACSDLSRLPELRRLERDHSQKHHFVTMDWVKESIDSGIPRNERLFEPRLV